MKKSMKTGPLFVLQKTQVTNKNSNLSIKMSNFNKRVSMDSIGSFKTYQKSFMSPTRIPLKRNQLLISTSKTENGDSFELLPEYVPKLAPIPSVIHEETNSNDGNTKALRKEKRKAKFKALQTHNLKIQSPNRKPIFASKSPELKRKSPITSFKRSRKMQKLPSQNFLVLSPLRKQSIQEAFGFMKPKEGIL